MSLGTSNLVIKPICIWTILKLSHLDSQFKGHKISFLKGNKNSNRSNLFNVTNQTNCIVSQKIREGEKNALVLCWITCKSCGRDWFGKKM